MSAVSIEQKHGIVAYYLDDVLEPEAASEALDWDAARDVTHQTCPPFVRPAEDTPTFDFVLRWSKSHPEKRCRLMGDEINAPQPDFYPDLWFLWVRSIKGNLTTADLIEIFDATSYGDAI